MSARLIVFDMDGTLVDSEAHIHRAFVDAHAAVSRPPAPRREMLSVVGLALPAALARLQPDLAEADVRVMEDAYRASYIRARTGGVAPLFPGALALLDALARRSDTVLAIATGASRRGADEVLRHHDIGSRFASVQTADGNPSKPDPSMLRAILDETGIAAGRSTMVGDTTFDILMAASAGMRPIGVGWGHHDADDLLAAGAETVCPTMDELAAILDMQGRARHG